MSPYQHSAENTCFGIIKLHSKASTSTGEGELAPLSTENLCAENKHSGHAAADHSGITNALESPKWKWMQYTCGARSNNGPPASERYHNSTNHLLMLWWGYNGGELVDYPVCICLHSGEFSIMLLSNIHVVSETLRLNMASSKETSWDANPACSKAPVPDRLEDHLLLVWQFLVRFNRKVKRCF